MGTLRCAWVILITLAVSFPASAVAQNARIRITLNEVPTKSDVTVELFVAWGARIKDPRAGWLKGHQAEFSGPRSSRSIETDTDTVLIHHRVDSFILYGRVRNKNDGTVIGYVPAKLFDDIRSAPSLTQLEVETTMRKSFEEAFLDSYPLEFNKDQGYLKTDNVRPVLRSLKLMIEYAGETGAELSNDAWQRFHSFFKGNRSFFKRGGSGELTDILAFLKTYSSASGDPNFAAFYAEFLNELVGVVQGTSVFDGQELTSYIHDQLKLLYGKGLTGLLGPSSRSLQKFQEIKQYESCLDLADVILHKLTTEVVNEESRPTISGVLLSTTYCGQLHFEEDSDVIGADRRLSDDGAKFLLTTPIGRSVMEQYLQVAQFLFDKGMLSLRSTGREGEIVKYYVAYNQALQGAPGL